ncbi:hypothetical protein KUTeg_017957 [Tegillarca granosa]|uniref:Uncharacterized protein n=1 Tax=Tegillarca granosa TaxID=220873 RepID=A0ABQ9EGF0_TEGGR|nr:hypothetical protein KUTeg_017957 [Tegillarca granosa]
MCNFYTLYYTYHKTNTLDVQYCFKDAQTFHWKEYLKNIPNSNASSVDGIPEFQRTDPFVKASSHRHPKHVQNQDLINVLQYKLIGRNLSNKYCTLKLMTKQLNKYQEPVVSYDCHIQRYLYIETLWLLCNEKQIIEITNSVCCALGFKCERLGNIRS